MKRWLMVVSILGLATPPAWAAGPFDGEWSGANCYEAPVALKVADGRVSGTMSTGRQVFPIGGKVDASGKFNGGWITGQFTGTNFKGAYTRQAGSTASDAGQQCLVTAERK